MNVYVDTKLVHQANSKKNALLKMCIQADLLKGNPQVVFSRPAFFECLGLRELFETIPKFDEGNKIYNFLTSHLASNAQKELLIYLYDQIFVECLTYVKAIPEIHPHFLLDRIQHKRQTTNELFSMALDSYEQQLIQNPSNIIHDLILYLAWDRVCVNLALIFEHISENPHILNSLDVLKECLIESFQHITAQGRTAPSFFRLMEALYAYQMREEHLLTYHDSEWIMLCQSATALRSREDVVDVVYIDAAITAKDSSVVKVWTMDSEDKVKASVSFAQYMIEKLKGEVPNWQYMLRPMEIVCLKENDNEFTVSEILTYL